MSKNISLYKALLLSALVPAFTGCSTVIEGRSQEIVINTDPPGATCALMRNNLSIGTVSPTPGAVVVQKTKYDIRVKCTMEGYQQAAYVNKSDSAGVAFANVVPIGWAIDSASGADNKYDSPINIMMFPEEKPVASDSTQHHHRHVIATEALERMAASRREAAKGSQVVADEPPSLQSPSPIQPEPEAETEIQPQSQLKSSSQPEAEAEVQPQLQHPSQPEAEAEIQPQPQSESENQPQLPLQPEAVLAPQEESPRSSVQVPTEMFEQSDNGSEVAVPVLTEADEEQPVPPPAAHHHRKKTVAANASAAPAAASVPSMSSADMSQSQSQPQAETDPDVTQLDIPTAGSAMAPDKE